MHALGVRQRGMKKRTLSDKDNLIHCSRLGSREISLNQDSRSRTSLSSSFASWCETGSSELSRQIYSNCRFLRWSSTAANFVQYSSPMSSFNSLFARMRVSVEDSDLG